MIAIEFTENEITALRQLLHRAVLHSGMDVAEAATVLNNKLIEAVTRSRLAGGNGKLQTDASLLNS